MRTPSPEPRLAASRRQPRRFALVLVAALALLAAPARAARWLTDDALPARLHAAPWHDEATLVAAGRRLLAERAADLGMAGATVEPSGLLVDQGAGVVRFRQRHLGLPVRGGSVVLRLEPTGAVHAVVIDLAPPLVASAVPSVPLAAARALVAGLVGPEHAASVTPAQLEEGGGALGFERNDARGGVLVWYLDASSAAGPRRFLVDAQRGRLLGALPIAREANGRVYAINPVQTPKPSDVPLLELDAGSPQHLNGFAGKVQVYDWVSGALGSTRAPLKLEQVTTPNAGPDFLYDPLKLNNTRLDPFAEVNIYYHLTRIRDFFTTTLGVDMSATKWALVGVANYGPDGGYFDNAFYTPWSSTFGAWPGNARNAIFIGNGHTLNFAYDSDVFLHEFTHFVNHNAIDFNRGTVDFDQYGVVTMPAAMDEGTADYFSCTVNGDPVIGEASLGPDARDLSQPGPHCPDGLSGESHADGQILATAAWAIRGALGRDIADKLLWTSMTMFPDSPTFGDAANGILAAAKAMKLDATQAQAIKDALAANGLDDCGRFLAIDSKARTVSLFGLQLLADLFGSTCSGVRDTYGLSMTAPFQFVYTPAAGDKAVTFHATTKLGSGQGRGGSWALYGRAGSEVSFDNSGALDTADYQVTGITGTLGDLTIDARSTPPFDPNQTYYFAIGNTECAAGTVRVYATNADAVPDMAVSPDSSPVAVDASSLPPPPSSTGCSCSLSRSAPASSSGAPALALAACAFLLLSRRRRAAR